MLSIGQMSRRSGVKIPTIRFYEQKGLLSAPGRTAGNQRRYSPDALKQLSFIRHARDLGLPLRDVAALISLEGAQGDTLEEAHKIAQKQQIHLQARIIKLQRLERELGRISSACSGNHDHICEVLHAFGDHDACDGAH